MHPPEEIHDPADPRVADYVGLTDAARRMRHEPEAGFFIAEGEKVVVRAAAAGYPARSLLVSPSRYAELDPALLSLGCPVHVASFDVLRAVTGFHVHRGVLASFGRLPVPSAAEVLALARRVVVMEEVTNHTNLGAVFRSAAGLGMDAVLLGPRSCDPLYRRAVRVSMGQVFAVPYAVLDRWPEGLGDLRDAGFRVLALTPSATATRLEDVVLGEDDRAALVLGAEGPGLTEEAMAASDERVRIPMAAGVDSLNVAAAAAVACWALGRRP
ncbi:MAG TPA: RNA methyltransferase [Mycobacteriales bacterium]|nr:RNA methyltransferase [Mycobacteriales bacterium]